MTIGPEEAGLVWIAGQRAVSMRREAGQPDRASSDPRSEAKDAAGNVNTLGEVDAQSDQSFPASDPPSWSGSRI